MTTERIDVLAVLDRAIARNIERGAAKGSQSDRDLREARDDVAELIAATSSLLDNLEAWNEAPATGFPQHDFTRVCRALARAEGVA